MVLAGINLGSNDLGYNNSCVGVSKPIPGSGPVDWFCDGNLTDTWCPNGCTGPFRELNSNDGNTPNSSPGSGDVLMPFEDWPNLIFAFQCNGSTFNSGAVARVGYGKALSSGEMTGDEMLRPEPLCPGPGKSSCRRKSPQ